MASRRAASLVVHVSRLGYGVASVVKLRMGLAIPCLAQRKTLQPKPERSPETGRSRNDYLGQSCRRLHHRNRGCCDRNVARWRRSLRLRMTIAREPMDEVIGRPRARKLHLALAHHCAGGRKFVLVALHALAVDQVGDIEHHLAIVHQPAADFLVERRNSRCIWKLTARARVCRSRAREAFSRRLLRYSRPTLSAARLFSISLLQQSSTKIFRCISVLPRSLSMLPRNWR